MTHQQALQAAVGRLAAENERVAFRQVRLGADRLSIARGQELHRRVDQLLAAAALAAFATEVHASISASKGSALPTRMSSARMLS